MALKLSTRQHQRAPGRDGLWPAGGWETANAPRGARSWAAGWDRARKCPPDPMRRRQGSRTFGAAPVGGWCRGSAWRDAWQDSRQVARTLRRAGYVARHRWEKAPAEHRKIGRNVLELWRYLDGPAVGQVAADPWDMARKIMDCSSSWYKQLRHQPGSLTVVKAPRRCGRRHVCPICAAKNSSSLARALRALVIDRDAKGTLGEMALVTWTQRAHLGESLAEALARFRDGWSRMTTGRPGRAFKALVNGWYLGLEVTRTWARKGAGEPEPEAESALGWHVHGHVVLELHRSLSSHDARPALGKAWAQASGAAAEVAGIPGFGWDPYAGGCQVEAGKVVDWAGAWWREIDPQAPAEVYQACKYPTPLAELRPVGMAEWLATAWGKRWHQGGGIYRSVRRDAKELVEDTGPAEVIDEDTGQIHTAPELGELVTGCGPDDAPPAEGADPDVATWRLLWKEDDLAPAGFNDLVWAAGGNTHKRHFNWAGQEPYSELWVQLPAAFVDARMGESEAALEDFAQLRDKIRERRREAQGRQHA